MRMPKSYKKGTQLTWPLNSTPENELTGEARAASNHIISTGISTVYGGHGIRAVAVVLPQLVRAHLTAYYIDIDKGGLASLPHSTCTALCLTINSAY